MTEFTSQREAKEYLAGRIVAEAEWEGKPLPEIERQMLYFSETDWAPPGMLEANAEFERTCDTGDYERKVAALIRKIEERGKAEGGPEQQAWDDAVTKLSEGDHYLLVMLKGHLAPAGKSSSPLDHLFKLWLTGFCVVLGLVALLLLYHSLFG